MPIPAILALLAGVGTGMAASHAKQTLDKRKQADEAWYKTREDLIKSGDPNGIMKTDAYAKAMKTHGLEETLPMDLATVDYYKHLNAQSDALTSGKLAADDREATTFQQMQSGLYGPGIPDYGNPPLASSAYNNTAPSMTDSIMPSPNAPKKPTYTQLSPEERKAALFPSAAGVISAKVKTDEKTPNGSQPLEDISLRDKNKPYGKLSQADRKEVYTTWEREQKERKAEEEVFKRNAILDQNKIVVSPLIEQAVESKTFNWNMFRNSDERTAGLVSIAEKYPNVDMNKMYSNSKFQGDPILNRAIVWADAAEPRLDALADKIKELKPGQFPSVNAFRNWLAYQLGSEEIADAISGINSTLFETLRAIGGSGQFTDFRLKLEQSQMNPAMNQGQFAKSVGNLKSAIAALKEARGKLPFEDIRIDPTKPYEMKPSKKRPALRKELNEMTTPTRPPLDSFRTP